MGFQPQLKAGLGAGSIPERARPPQAIFLMRLGETRRGLQSIHVDDRVPAAE